MFLIFTFFGILSSGYLFLHVEECLQRIEPCVANSFYLILYCIMAWIKETEDKRENLLTSMVQKITLVNQSKELRYKILRLESPYWMSLELTILLHLANL